MSSLVVAVHQPNYVPWLGFFAKALACDVFVLYDTVQFEKRGFTNRVKIKTDKGVQWLTQPVRVHGRYTQLVREVEFADEDWRTRHLRCLELNYTHAPSFSEYFPALSDLLRGPAAHLVTCNERLIFWIFGILGIRAKLMRASELGLTPADTPTERLIQVVQAVGGSTYVSGSGGFNYQDLDKFAQHGISVVRRQSTFPRYSQLWGEFSEGLSILDLLFNCGASSRSCLGA